jgi:hypothetical protein
MKDCRKPGYRGTVLRIIMSPAYFPFTGVGEDKQVLFGCRSREKPMEENIQLCFLCRNTLLKKGYLIVVKGFELLFYGLFPNLRFCANRHALLSTFRNFVRSKAYNG